MNCFINVPFGSVPRELIEQLNNCPYSYDEYLDNAIIYDALPVYWNMAFMEDDEMVGFIWGMYDTLDRFMHIIRFSFLPHARSGKEHCLKAAWGPLKELAHYYGANNMFFISDRPEVFTSKLREIHFSKGQLMEVSLYENLH